LQVDREAGRSKQGVADRQESMQAKKQSLAGWRRLEKAGSDGGAGKSSRPVEAISQADKK
jgi:hypothetical protein